jgi:hypothetical protein
MYRVQSCVVCCTVLQIVCCALLMLRAHSCAGVATHPYIDAHFASHSLSLSLFFPFQVEMAATLGVQHLVLRTAGHGEL